MEPSSTSIRAHIITMGCAKNEVDSAKMSERLLAAGVKIVDDPASADAIIVNTCSFIQAATEESLEMIFDMLDMPNVAGGDSRVIVAGCMPASYGEDLSESLQEVKTFVPCSKEDDIVQIIFSLFPEKAQSCMPIPDVSKLVAADSPSAYVKISDGCDRFCSFCAIPYIRGPYGSFTYESICSEVALQVNRGVKEIVLIAQDTGRWGEEFSQEQTLAWLLGKLADEFTGTWFRVMYLEPEGVTDELIECIRSHENVCSYLDIPFQHVDPQILRSMNRRGSYEEFAQLIEKLRMAIPDIVLRTTLIAGFPGETQEQFELLCDFLEEVQLDYVGVFPYSQEEGTRAATLPGQIDEQEKIDRAQMIRDLCDRISESLVRQRVGEDLDVLVLGTEEDGQVYGRAMCQAPEVDGVVYLSQGEPGDVVRVRIHDSLMYEMEGW